MTDFDTQGQLFSGSLYDWFCLLSEALNGSTSEYILWW